MKKFGYLLLLIAFIYGCERPEKPIKPFDRGSVITNSVSMGNTYADHIFSILIPIKLLKPLNVWIGILHLIANPTDILFC